jgi:hypothetical protein
LLSVGCHSDVLRLVGHGEGAILGDGLQKSQKDQGSRAEASREGQVFPSRFIPPEFGLLYEEGLSTIPTRCFHGVRIGDVVLGG